jgi:hypothetical protein
LDEDDVDRQGSPVTGIVQSVKEIDSIPMRWIVTVVANQRVAA